MVLRANSSKAGALCLTALAATLIAAPAAAQVTRSITVKSHDNITFTNAQTDSMLSLATNLLRDNDGSGPDFNCLVTITRNGNLTEFNVTDGNINTDAEVSTILNTVGGYVKIVDSLTRCAMTTGTYTGCANTTSLVMTNESATGTGRGITLAHEYGHTVGLGDVPDTTRIMHGTLLPGLNRVTSTECNSYDNPIDANGPSPGFVARSDEGSGAGTDQRYAGGSAAVIADLSEVAIEDIATMGFADRVPFEVVDYFGSKDVEVLRGLLRESKHEDSWSTVLSLIGLLSSSRAEDAKTLREFAAAPERRGEHVVAAGIALGYLATNEDSALDYLSAMIQSDDRYIIQAGITGLGLSGRPQATEQLQKLRANRAEALDPEKSAALIGQALSDNQLVSQRGLRSYYLDR